MDRGQSQLTYLLSLYLIHFLFALFNLSAACLWINIIKSVFLLIEGDQHNSDRYS